MIVTSNTCTTGSMCVFRFYHNHVKVNKELGRAPPQDNTFTEYMRFIKPIHEAIA
jgi:hypothetical protein